MLILITSLFLYTQLSLRPLHWLTQFFQKFSQCLLYKALVIQNQIFLQAGRIVLLDHFLVFLKTVMCLSPEKQASIINKHCSQLPALSKQITICSDPAITYKTVFQSYVGPTIPSQSVWKREKQRSHNPILECLDEREVDGSWLHMKQH